MLGLRPRNHVRQHQRTEPAKAKLQHCLTVRNLRDGACECRKIRYRCSVAYLGKLGIAEVQGLTNIRRDIPVPMSGGVSEIVRRPRSPQKTRRVPDRHVQEIPVAAWFKISKSAPCLQWQRGRAGVRVSAARLDAGVNTKVPVNRFRQITVKVTGDFFAGRAASRQQHGIAAERVRNDVLVAQTVSAAVRPAVNARSAALNRKLPALQIPTGFFH